MRNRGEHCGDRERLSEIAELSSAPEVKAKSAIAKPLPYHYGAHS
jgi:hypothetical protein